MKKVIQNTLKHKKSVKCRLLLDISETDCQMVEIFKNLT